MAKSITGKGATGMSGGSTKKVGPIRTPFTNAVATKGGKFGGKR